MGANFWQFTFVFQFFLYKFGDRPNKDWKRCIVALSSCLPIPFNAFSSMSFHVVWNEILQSLNPKDREQEFHPEMISDSVELCETEVCFLHIQLIGTNVWLPKMHNVPPDVDFESSRSPAKSKYWNHPTLQCCAVFSHDNIVWVRVSDECTRSNGPSVCHKI